MTRPRLRSLAMTAAAATMLLSAAAPALAQETPPPSAGSVPPPIQAMAAPKGSEDMTGSIGFGVGVLGGTQTLIHPNDSVALKYWLSDVLAVSPELTLNITKPTPPGATGPASDTQWSFSPSAVVLFVPFRSTTTRFSVGGGLGISLIKNPPADTDVVIRIPIQAGVEHFFARWFSLGIAARTDLFNYHKNTSVRILGLDTTAYLGQLFFYTD